MQKKKLIHFGLRYMSADEIWHRPVISLLILSQRQPSIDIDWDVHPKTCYAKSIRDKAIDEIVASRDRLTFAVKQAGHQKVYVTFANQMYTLN